MLESTVIGLNSITHPHLEAWNWLVAVYLFMGGLSAGLLVMSSIANLKKWPVSGEAAHCERGAMMAPFILAVGMIFIFLDLSRKANMYWFYLTFQPSASMSWGAWGIGMIIPLGILYGLSTMSMPERANLKFPLLINLSARLHPHMAKFSRLAFGMGVFLGGYTGILLSSMLARPLWNSSVLPVLFLVSALSTGTAFLIMIARRTEVKLFYTKIDIWLIIAELVVIVLFFYGHFTSTAIRKASILPFFTLTSDQFMYFFSVMFVAILLPLALVLKLTEVGQDHADELTPATIFRMNLSAVLVLIGGLILRLAIVYAGQLSRFL